MPNYSKNEVLLVQDPFSDVSATKIRPAVVISGPHRFQDVIIILLTSRTSPLSDGEFILDWRKFWLIPCIGVVVALGVFVAFFRA